MKKRERVVRDEVDPKGIDDEEKDSLMCGRNGVVRDD